MWSILLALSCLIHTSTLYSSNYIICNWKLEYSILICPLPKKPATCQLRISMQACPTPKPWVFIIMYAYHAGCCFHPWYVTGWRVSVRHVKGRSLTGQETIIYLEPHLALISVSRVSQGSRTWLHFGIHKEKLKIQPKHSFEEPRGHCLSLKQIKDQRPKWRNSPHLVYFPSFVFS